MTLAEAFGMNEFGEWDESTARGYESIPVLIYNMQGAACMAETEPNSWDRTYLCARNRGHTGRHLAMERHGWYVIAVWR